MSARATSLRNVMKTRPAAALEAEQSSGRWQRASSRRVAEAHGGSTGILNRPGVGATFWLRVPA